MSRSPPVSSPGPTLKVRSPLQSPLSPVSPLKKSGLRSRKKLTRNGVVAPRRSRGLARSATSPRLHFVQEATGYFEYLVWALGMRVMAAAGQNEPLHRPGHMPFDQVQLLQRAVRVLVALDQQQRAAHPLQAVDHGPGALRRIKPHLRSEERRVGKEGRSRWSPYH